MKVTTLTKEQKEKIPGYRQAYLSKIFCENKPANEGEVREYFHWVYNTFKISKNKKPKVFIVNSPYEIYIAIAYLKTFIKNMPKLELNELGGKTAVDVYDKIHNEVVNKVRNEVVNEVRTEIINEVFELYNRIDNEIGSEIVDKTNNAVLSEIWGGIGYEVYNEVNNKIGDEVDNRIGNEIKTKIKTEVINEVFEIFKVFKEINNEMDKEIVNEDKNRILSELWGNVMNRIRDEVNVMELEWYQPSWYLSVFNSWIYSYDFFDKECFKLGDSTLFNGYKKILDLNIFWSVPFENYVFVSRNATKYVRDDRNKLHSVFEPAIQFGGEYRYHLYYIHGVNIQKALFKKLSLKEYTFNDWIREESEEVKSAILAFMEERWGSEYLFRFISDNLKEVDTYTDKKDDIYLEGTTRGMNIGVYTLFKGQLNNINMAFIRCYCPSSDRMFFLCVDAKNQNAKDAIASLYRVPAKLKNEIKYIQRQGERFSTVFTETGNSILKSMPKEEIENLVHISGDEYFKKMRYEY